MSDQMAHIPQAGQRRWTCDCGAVHDRVWWDPPPRLTRYSARWVAPSISPCHLCREEGSGEADRLQADLDSLRRRQRRAGVSQRDRAWSLDLTVDVKGMSKAEVRQAVSRAPKGSIGVIPSDAALVEALREWRAGRWMYIYGEPGTGKTVMVSALANRLLRGGEERWEWRDPAEDVWHDIPAGYSHAEIVAGGAQLRMVRRPTMEGVVVITDDELWARCTLSWSGDRDPLHQVYDARLLILDDLGVATHPKAKENIERLISARYRDELTTVIASNIPWDELGSVYGRRVASRLAEQVPPRHRHVLRHNWRE